MHNVNPVTVLEEITT